MWGVKILLLIIFLSLSLTRCLHSLSRSTKLLRTSIVDAEVWKSVLDMLSLRDEECLQVASGVVSNLLLAFSPSREVLFYEQVARAEQCCMNVSHMIRAILYVS